jgi:glycosyltransferase involved in cell wall biosynthesis
VGNRLKSFCDIDAAPLYHPPPNAEQFYCAPAEDYILFPSRVCLPKRQSLVIEALAQTRNPVRVRVAGIPDRPSYLDELKSLARKLKVADRVTWLDDLPYGELRDHYARSLAVVYPPMDEDYGYVTLEAMLASKPLVTCTDSGGPLEFVIHEETGLIAEPNAKALAAALDRVWEVREQARTWGEAGRARYDALGLSWSKVVRTLLA